ncbi:sulfatase [candidate division KSB1 bacterium]|nr:sulfatase [candidate division KSB1 bacterium]
MSTLNSTNLPRRKFLLSMGLAAASLAGPLFLPGCSKKKKLNFVFSLIDDLGWRDLGCYGSKFYETPNIDRLAAEGMRFTDAYAACPVCSPTRASILSGKYPARMHTTDWFGAPQPDTVEKHWTRSKPLLPAQYVDRLPLEEITIAEALERHGYATFFAGKWHLGREGYFPEDQGFEINKGGYHVGSPRGGYFSPYNNPKLADGPVGEHLPDRLANESVRFLEQAGAKPFLLYLSFYSVHNPQQAREDLKHKYEDKAHNINYEGEEFLPEGERMSRQVQNQPVYAGMVEAVDQAVGKVLTALDQLGLAEDTAIIFMSDNGGLSTSEGSPTSNVPLRAGKGWLYEGGIRVPMIVKWPGMVKPGSIVSEPVVSTDFYPTMLEMAGLPLLDSQHVDGRSLAAVLRGNDKIDREAIFWHYPHYGNQGGSPSSAIRAGNYKLIQFYEDNRIELYDLAHDIGETRNLTEKMPEKAAELNAKLQDWLHSVNAAMPTKNPNAKTEE